MNNFHIMELSAAKSTVAQLTEAEYSLFDDGHWSYKVRELPQGKACIVVFDENGEELGRL